MANNFLQSNKAVFSFSPNERKLNLSLTGFSLPDLSLGAITTPTRFIDRKEPDNKLVISDLTVTFIVNEGMENYIELSNWIRGLGMPTEHDEYRGNLKRFQDGVITIFSSHNNPLINIKIYDMFPTSLGGLEFRESDSEATEITTTASFSVLLYEFERLDSSN